MPTSLKDSDVKLEVIRLENDGLSYVEIGKRVGLSAETISKFLRKLTYQDWWEKNSEKPIAAGDRDDHHKNIKKYDGGKKTVLFTSAQNNTFVFLPFYESLMSLKAHYDADLFVGTFSYNKGGFQNLEKGSAEFFDPKIQDYICDQPIQFADDLIWCGELNILPTAKRPFSGLESYTQSRSGIIPHAKLQLKSLTRHKTVDPRFLYTTGAITKRNYIQKKEGQSASFHHVFSALLVEFDEEGNWFARQIVSDDNGVIHDLDLKFDGDQVYENQVVEAINWGDIHIEKMHKPAVMASFFAKDSMLNVLRPRYQFIHDVIDFEARNHHNIRDPYFLYQMHINQRERVEDNVELVATFLEKIERDYCQSVVVESNHDLAFKKWLRESDYKNDPVNALYYLKNQLAIYQAIHDGKKEFSVFEHAVKQFKPGLETKFLREDESFMICEQTGNGIQCGDHGHLGNNGGRPSDSSYTVRGSKYNVGHTHRATIVDGYASAGVLATLDMGYNKGGVANSHSNLVTYPNGKRAIVTIKNGRWRA